MTSGVISPAKLFFLFVTGPIPIYTESIPGLYRVLPGLVPNSPSSYSSSLSFSPCPHRVLTVSSPCHHRVHTASSEICNVALKYLLLLWNIFYCSEICTAALKYVLMHQNIYCHSEICYPDGMHTLAKPHYTVHYGHRPTNGSITASYRPHVLLPFSYRVLTVCHHLYPPGEKFSVCPKLSPGPAGSRRPLTGHQRVHRSLNAPPCALTVFHRPHEIYHTVAHGRLSRCHVTATLELA